MLNESTFSSSTLAFISKLSKADSLKDEMEANAMKGILYASACCSLMYAMVATRPDIAYAMGVISRYVSNLGKAHWEDVKCLSIYLSSTQRNCMLRAGCI